MYGMTAILVGLLARSLFLYAFGWALFVDELTYLLTKGKTHEDNYAMSSVLGTALFVVLTFFLRNYLIRPLAG